MAIKKYTKETKASTKLSVKKTAAKAAEVPEKKTEKPAPVKVEKAASAKGAKANETSATKSAKGVTGKYKIEKALGTLYMFYLYANNGQLLYESKEYSTKKSCLDGIETFKRNIADEATSLRIDMDKNKRYKYIFKNRNSIYVGETYSNKAQAESSAESVKKFAPVSPIVEI